MMRRRDLLAGFLATGVSGVLGMCPAYARTGPLRIGITPVFLDNQTGFIDRWGGYLENRLGVDLRLPVPALSPRAEAGFGAALPG